MSPVTVTFIIAAVLLGAAVFPALAFVAGLVILGMGIHALLSNGTTMPDEYERLPQHTVRQLDEARRRLDREI